MVKVLTLVNELSSSHLKIPIRVDVFHDDIHQLRQFHDWNIRHDRIKQLTVSPPGDNVILLRLRSNSYRKQKCTFSNIIGWLHSQRSKNLLFSGVGEGWRITISLFLERSAVILLVLHLTRCLSFLLQLSAFVVASLFDKMPSFVIFPSFRTLTLSQKWTLKPAFDAWIILIGYRPRLVFAVAVEVVIYIVCC